MNSPRCIICIPFQSEEIERKQAFDFVYNHYQKLGYNIFIGESDPFSRAASRNGSVPKNIDWDIAIFIDADIIVPLDQIQKAIDLSYKENSFVLAYSCIYFLTKKLTEKLYQTNEFPKKETYLKSLENQISGAFVVSRDLWEKVGGQDERFTEWGGEDRAFYYSCAVENSCLENPKIEGCAYHLYHRRKPKHSFKFLFFNSLLTRYRYCLDLSPSFQTNQEKVEKYQKDNISILLKEPHGPLNCSNSDGFLSCPTSILSGVLWQKECTFLDEPLIGVTIPCFKSKFFIQRALNSVLKQTYKNFMVFLISDGDISSFDLIRNIKDNRVMFLYSKKNRGRYATDHLALSHILPLFNCKYWAPLDSDDYAEPDWLETMITEIQDHDAVFTAQNIVKPFKTYIEFPKPYTHKEEFIWSAHLSGLWKLSYVLENNLTNPRYRVGWDTIMTLVPQIKDKVKFINKPLYNRVQRKDSLTTSRQTGIHTPYRENVKRELKKLWNIIVKDPDNLHETLRKARIKEIL